MFKVVNIKSSRSGRPVANQFKVIMDTAYTTRLIILLQIKDIQERHLNIKKYFMKSMENT